MRYEYEKGSKKHTCPSCGKNRFVRLVDNQTGGYLSSETGRCDRESSCGYILKSKEYFKQNPNKRKTYKLNIKPNLKPKRIKRDFYTVPFHQFQNTLGDYENNSFVQFLYSNFDSESVLNAITEYFIGTFENGKTIYWQVDSDYKIRTGKIINYDCKTGKRIKETFINKNSETITIPASWIHKKWFREWELETCIFGEHLIRDSKKTIAIVEAEKTAIICSILIPKYTWLAIGGLSYLTLPRLQKLHGKKVLLYPDSEKRAFELWSKRAIEARQIGLGVTCSTLIENNATDEQKAKGYDLADFLLESLDKNSVSATSALTVKNDGAVVAPSNIKLRNPHLGRDSVKISKLTCKQITDKLNSFYKKGIKFETDLNDINNIFVNDNSVFTDEDLQFFTDNTLEIAYIWQANLIKQQIPKDECEQFEFELAERVALGGDISSLLQITKPIYKSLLTR